MLNIWFHVGYVKVGKGEYEAIIEADDTFKWFCTKCNIRDKMLK